MLILTQLSSIRSKYLGPKVDDYLLYKMKGGG